MMRIAQFLDCEHGFWKPRSRCAALLCNRQVFVVRRAGTPSRARGYVHRPWHRRGAADAIADQSSWKVGRIWTVAVLVLVAPVRSRHFSV
jgi:hypothetical protein